MIRYEVTLAPTTEIAARLEQYMRTVHIPALLATGFFSRIRFEHCGERFRTVYILPARADLERYLAEHADNFRADFHAHFPDGVTITRSVWEEVESWEKPS